LIVPDTFSVELTGMSVIPCVRFSVVPVPMVVEPVLFNAVKLSVTPPLSVNVPELVKAPFAINGVPDVPLRLKFPALVTVPFTVSVVPVLGEPPSLTLKVPVDVIFNVPPVGVSVMLCPLCRLRFPATVVKFPKPFTVPAALNDEPAAIVGIPCVTVSVVPVLTITVPELFSAFTVA
jgi:hypothetical protein